jgi:hypothetical protein
MSNQHSFVSTDHCDGDLYTSSQTAERVLNAAIVRGGDQREFRSVS